MWTSVFECAIKDFGLFLTHYFRSHHLEPKGSPGSTGSVDRNATLPGVDARPTLPGGPAQDR